MWTRKPKNKQQSKSRETCLQVWDESLWHPKRRHAFIYLSARKEMAMFHLQKSQSVNKGFVKYSFVIVYMKVLCVTICIYKYYISTYCYRICQFLERYISWKNILNYDGMDTNICTRNSVWRISVIPIFLNFLSSSRQFKRSLKSARPMAIMNIFPQ